VGEAVSQSAARLRRSRSLVCFWHGGDLVVEHYLSRQRTALDPVAVSVLSLFDDWTEPETAIAALDDYDANSVRAALVALTETHLLVREGSAEAERDASAERQWATWIPEASLMHFGTRDPSYVETTPESAGELVRSGRPALFKTYPDAPRIVLPRGPLRCDASFAEVLYGRRTCRRFAAEPIDLQTLSSLLAAVFGPTEFVDAEEFGVLYQRTSAAGGARQEIEAYVAACNVEAVQPGLYHYNALEHSLEVLDASVGRSEVLPALAAPAPIDTPAVVVFLTAVLERMAAKYRHPRAYRVLLMNAGHLAQTFAMTCTALDLGPFQAAAFNDQVVEDMLGIDGIGEIALYVLATGLRASGQEAPAAGPDAFARTTLAQPALQPRRTLRCPMRV
jgi:SagB-type dehydrogenase family enzyme